MVGALQALGPPSTPPAPEVSGLILQWVPGASKSHTVLALLRTCGLSPSKCRLFRPLFSHLHRAQLLRLLLGREADQVT